MFGLLAFAAVLIVIAIVLHDAALRLMPEPTSPITSFEDCVAAGYPVAESYLRQCFTPDGNGFTETLPEETGGGMTFNGCAVAGCGGELCVSAEEADDIVTTCEFRPEYACYREAPCEPQADGVCGWTMTEEVEQCLVDPPVFEDAEDAIVEPQ